MTLACHTLVFCRTAWACIEQYLWTLSGNRPRIITVIWHYRKAFHKWQHRSLYVGSLFSKYILNGSVCEVDIEFIVPFICVPILYRTLILLFYQFCLQSVRYIHIRNLSQSYHYIVAFIYDLYLWICIYGFFIFIYSTLQHGTMEEQCNWMLCPLWIYLK